MAAEELGRISRPQAGDVATRRKLYIVPLVYPIPGAPDGYASRLEKYWKAVDEQVSRLEGRAGVVNHIFHEGIGHSGQTGLDELKQVNMPAFPFVNSRVQSGATMDALEDEDLLAEAVDWGRCLQVGLQSESVFNLINEKYTQVTEARFEHISKRLNEGVSEGEAAVLIVADTRGIKTPDKAEVFNIVPPELDQLSRWLQQQFQREAAAAQGARAQPSDQQQEQESQEPAGGTTRESGLWTPGR